MNRDRVSSILLAVAAFIYAVIVIRRGFSAADQPSYAERVMARTVRNISIPSHARNEKNPVSLSPEVLAEARNHFGNLCANCHGNNGTGPSNIGQNLYPKAPDLRLPATQNLTDGEIHYIIKNGVRLTAMPAWGNPHIAQDDTDAWKLVLFVRSIAGLSPQEQSQQATAKSAHYVGSAACQKCHAANLRALEEDSHGQRRARSSRASRSHHPRSRHQQRQQKFTKADVAFVYGSIWKQRYFTKIGDDYFPQPAQWDVANHVWKPYFVAKGTDWWEPFYPPDNMQRPTGATCDGCHSVDYNIQTKQSRRVECRLRTLPRPGQRTRRSRHARQHSESLSHGLRRRQRYLHPVPLARPPAHESHRGKILRLARRL